MCDKNMTCNECGMTVSNGEYHPFAACLMYKGCYDSKTVTANLYSIRETATRIPSDIKIGSGVFRKGLKFETIKIAIDRQNDLMAKLITEVSPGALIRIFNSLD